MNEILSPVLEVLAFALSPMGAVGDTRFRGVGTMAWPFTHSPCAGTDQARLDGFLPDGLILCMLQVLPIKIC
jgi:hypothetical protein